MEKCVEANGGVCCASGEDEEAEGGRGVYSEPCGRVYVRGCGGGDGEMGVGPVLQAGVVRGEVARGGCRGKEAREGRGDV